LIPLQVDPDIDISTITQEINDSYKLKTSFTRLSGSQSDNLLGGKITDYLPIRRSQVLLLLSDISDFTDKYQGLSLLPDELIIDILAKLPVKSIIDLCQSSQDLNRFCDDEQLWRYLVGRDFSLDRKPDNKTWKEIYSIEYSKKYSHLTIDQKLVIAARKGILATVKIALNLGATSYNIAYIKAEAGGHLEVVKFLSDLIRSSIIPSKRKGKSLSDRLKEIVDHNAGVETRKKDFPSPPFAPLGNEKLLDVSRLEQNGVGAREISLQNLPRSNCYTGNLPITSNSIEKYAMALNMLDPGFFNNDINGKLRYLREFERYCGPAFGYKDTDKY
jgi:hypothetical protein